MGLKVADVFSTVNTKKNVFYSAYLKNKVQFNDVDPDKIQLLTDDEPSSDVTNEATETTRLNIDNVELNNTKSPDIESNEEPVIESNSQPKVDTISDISQSVEADGSIDVPVDTSTNTHDIIFQDSQPDEEKSEDKAVELPTPADNSV